ncbi:hypothetical protein Brsp06_02089 [Brucella sp. NBRC 13694]
MGAHNGIQKYDEAQIFGVADGVVCQITPTDRTIVSHIFVASLNQR